MTRQNRVDPMGRLVSRTERGSLMGNRGCLHDPDGAVTRAWARKAWITCALEFRGRHRVVMSPGKYTELFFLDEATAFAAGHRPCATCRKEDYDRFRQAWIESRACDDGGAFAIKPVDNRLHAERVGKDGNKQTYRECAGRLPDGVMILEQDEPRLLWAGHTYAWSFAGYGEGCRIDADTMVEVLTPPSIVCVFSAGYRPDTVFEFGPIPVLTDDKKTTRG